MNAPQKPAESKFHCACGRGDLGTSMNQQLHLVRIPDGPLTRDCFRLAVAPVPEPKEGEVLLKVRFISVDAANRASTQGAGTVMAGHGLGEVVESRHPDFAVGDLVSGECGWQEYAALPGPSLVKRPHAKTGEDIVEGLDSLPDVLIGLLKGENRVERMVRISS